MSSPHDANKLWLEAIRDNISKIKVKIQSDREIDTDAVVTDLREQYRFITTLRKVKQRKTRINGFYRKNVNKN